MSSVYSVIVIGGGVVGLATLRELASAHPQEARHMLLLESSSDLVTGASSGNSGIFHSGFDAPTGSIEHMCMVQGYKGTWKALQDGSLHNALSRYTQHSRVPVARCGAVVVAWTQEERGKLQGVWEKATKNGVKAEVWDKETLYQHQGNLGPGALGAVYVADESIVDPTLLPYAYACHALELGAHIRCSCRVTDLQFDPITRVWTVTLNNDINQVVFSKCIINAAGLYGDSIAALAGTNTDFKITPRKGQFVLYKSPACHADRYEPEQPPSMILALPTDRTKGVLVSPTVYGGYLVGPTAEDQVDRTTATIDDRTQAMLEARGHQLCPVLTTTAITTRYAGLRPATQYRDYVIDCDPTHACITLGGIRSTGLSAGLGIGSLACQLYTTYLMGTVNNTAGQSRGSKAGQAPVWGSPPRFDRAKHAISLSSKL